MNIDDKILQKLEKLSALSIPDDKRAEFKEQLSKVVNFVEILNDLDLDSVEATVNIASGSTLFRDDEPVSSDVVNSVLKFAPKTVDRYFEVPKIIE